MVHVLGVKLKDVLEIEEKQTIGKPAPFIQIQLNKNKIPEQVICLGR